MSAHDILQGQLSPELTSQRPEDSAAFAFQLWTSMAAELSPIIGEDGFAMLFARSLFLTQASFPWLVSNTQQSKDAQFNALKICLEGRCFAEADAASKALLVTFTDALIVLIGEPLTSGILYAAWGGSVPESQLKRFDHE